MKTKYIILTILLIGYITDELSELNETADNSKIFDNANFFYKDFLETPMEVLYCGEDNSNIFVLTYEYGLYISKDYGESYERAVDKFKFPAYVNKHRISFMFQNPVDRNTIIFKSPDNVYFITRDCGDNISLVFRGMEVLKLKFHPIDKNKIITKIYILCNKLDKNCTPGYFMRYSEDGAKSWVNLGEAKRILNFEWARVSENAVDSPQNRIIFIHSEFIPEKNENKFSLYYTDDLFKSENLVLSNVKEFKLNSKFIYIDVIKNGKLVRMVSDSLGDFYYFYEISFDEVPQDNYKYEFLLTHNRNLNYITVHSKKVDLDFGNLYISDHWGHQYQAILNNLTCNYDIKGCEINIVKGLAGVMIANIYDDQHIKDILDISNISEQREEYARLYENMKRKIKTVISYDYGRTWGVISVKADNCVDCILNLEIKNTKSVKPGDLDIISQLAAPGILLGSGNIGYYKNDYYTPEGLFLSVDAGSTWKMILKGSYLYTIIDQGGFIVATYKDKNTNKLFISKDFGLKWHDIIFSDTLMMVDEFLLENFEKDHKFIIKGHFRNVNGKVTRFVTVDFTNVHERVCKHDESNKELSDFEEFDPSNFISTNNKCINGREVVFMRKKIERYCFIHDEEPLYRVKKICECTEDDWHCGFGYVYDKNKKCVKINSDNHNLNKLVLVNDNVKDKAQHCEESYKKNIKTFCEGGVNYINKNCKNNVSYLNDLNKQSLISFKLIGIIVIILIIIAILFKSNTLRNVKNMLSGNKSKNSFEMLKKKDNNNNEFGTSIRNKIDDDIFNNDNLFKSNNNTDCI